MRVRKIQKSDACEVSDLIRKNLIDVNSKDYPVDLLEKLAATYTPQILVSRSQNCDIFVAIEADRIVGTASLQSNGWVSDVFVHPAFQSSGSGRTLMTHVEKSAVERGLSVVTLPGSIAAVGSYEKLGYTKARGIVSEDGLQEFIMEKHLTGAASTKTQNNPEQETPGKAAAADL